MAVKELNNVAVYNAKIAKDGLGKTTDGTTSVQLYPGMVIATGLDGNVCPAVRGATSGQYGYTALSKAQVLGVLTDYTGGAGQTEIYIDPVGSTNVDPTTGEVIDNSNGTFAAIRRQAFSYAISEPINNVTNLTAGASGYQGPARGVGYFVAPSQVQVDFGSAAGNVLLAVKTNDNVGSSTAADTAFTGGDTYGAGDLLTYGTLTNAGKLVKVSGAIFGGHIVARVDKFNGKVAEVTLV
jgi:hypothetical protein